MPKLMGKSMFLALRSKSTLAHRYCQFTQSERRRQMSKRFGREV